MDRYVCSVCGYIYDPANGDPDSGIKAGTRFEDLPEIGPARPGRPKISLKRNKGDKAEAERFMRKKGHSPESDREWVILKGAIENTNEGFVTIGEDHQVIIFNKAAEKILESAARRCSARIWASF